MVGSHGGKTVEENNLLLNQKKVFMKNKNTPLGSTISIKSMFFVSVMMATVHCILTSQNIC